MGSCQNLFGVQCATGVPVENNISVCSREVYRLKCSEFELNYPIGVLRFQVVNILLVLISNLCHKSFQNLTS